MERVCPDVIVGEGTMHVFHISAVRKAFGPDRAMLKTITGRSYHLLGRWTAEQREETAERAAIVSSGTPPTALNRWPASRTRLFSGRGAASG
jgi:DNA-binding winged helix-turn-helix (wHTH) protein